MKLTRFIAAVLAITFSISINAQELGKVLSLRKKGSAVTFKCENNQQARISVISDDIIRVEVSSKKDFPKSAMIEYGFVKDDLEATPFKVEENKTSYQISTGKLSVFILKENFAVKMTDAEGRLIVQTNTNPAISVGEKNVLNVAMPADEHFFGFGFMRKTLDARGHKLSFRREYRWKEATLPFFMSTRGYAFYSNSVYNQDFDFTTKSDVPGEDYYSITSNDEDLDFYLIYGPDFPNILDRYTDLTGKSVMVPRWAFGLEYRLRYYGDQEEFLSVAKEFRNKEIPADIMALEPGWEDVPYSMDWKWSPERFPEAQEMINELNDMGFKLDLWESGVAPTDNITDKKTRLNWYNQRKEIVGMGVDMFKQDDPYPRSIISSELLDPVFARKQIKDRKLSAEELNNVANSLYTQTLFEEFSKQTNKRAVVMFHAYNASVASHQWPFQWAGDFQAENGMLNASLSGHAMVSYDIRNPYAAGWHQGFFTPFSVVDAWAYYREPWLYSESIEQSHRIYACLRSRLVPYYYSSLWQSHLTGIPIERPMVMYYHDDPRTHQMKSQFMVGDWFLLALSDVDDSPAGEKIDFWTGSQKGNHGRIYLPKGSWVNYWNGEEENITENQWVHGDWPEYLGGLLYVKAGAIIPMSQVKNYVGETADEIVVLDIYPHNESSYQLYEDDGISYDYEEGKYALTDIACNERNKEVMISISERKGSYADMPERRSFLLKVHSMLKPTKIVVDGEALDYFSNSEDLIYNKNAKGWYYDQSAKKCILKLDKGWQYLSETNGVDPLATIPLTAKNERIEWASEIKIAEKVRKIAISMPKKAVACIKANAPSIPADGQSLALLNISYKNLSEEIGTITAKINGPSSFLDDKNELSFNAEDLSKLKIKAGTMPGIAKITLQGGNIEPASYELAVYGEAAELVVESDRDLIAADNTNSATISARLLDKNGSLVRYAHSPIILKITGDAYAANDLKQDSIYVVNGIASGMVRAGNSSEEINIKTSFKDLKPVELTILAEKAEMQVRINPPEKVKLNSDGGWIPDQVDVFVNFKAKGQLLQNIEVPVTLNVYSKQGELLDTYVQTAKKGEVIFKDISYYKRPAQCMFEIVCEGYETVKRKVFANTWDDEVKKK